MAVAIRAEHLSKEYRLGTINHGMLFKDLQSWMARRAGRPDPHEKIGAAHYEDQADRFWALKDISFDIEQGDRVGIIGRNGAGKSTLLKILSRITAPTEGRVKIKGRVVSLLEVGTGFHPELTGRENIFLNGAILGMKQRQVAKKLDEIIAFSEIEKFIDTPVKRYSSGMYVRLAFAVAAHLDSDILLADEVLAVGDAAFQEKCLGKMRDVSTGEGRTVLFVSHQMAAVRKLCTEGGIVLDSGKVVGAESDIDTLIGKYYLQYLKRSASLSWDAAEAPGNEAIRIMKVAVFPPSGQSISIESGFLIETIFCNYRSGINLDFTYEITTLDGITVLHRGALLSVNQDSRRGNYSVRVKVPNFLLNAGNYKVTIIFGKDQRDLLFIMRDVVQFEILDTYADKGSNLQRLPGVVYPNLEWETEVPSL